MPALLPTFVLATVAIVARRLVSDVLDVLAAVNVANLAARRAEHVLDLMPAVTAEGLDACALAVIRSMGVSPDQAAVLLASEVLLTVQGFRPAIGDQLDGTKARRVQDVIEAVHEVERAARAAPAGASPEDIARGRWTGSKYVSGRACADITVDLRRELAAASKVAGPLHGVACRVRKTGHFGLAIEVVAVPDHAILLNPARVAAEMVDRYAFTGLSWQSARGAAIDLAATKLANGHSYRRGSDTGLHVVVTFAEGLRAAQRADIEAAVRLARAGAPSSTEIAPACGR